MFAKATFTFIHHAIGAGQEQRQICDFFRVSNHFDLTRAKSSLQRSHPTTSQALKAPLLLAGEDYTKPLKASEVLLHPDSP